MSIQITKVESTGEVGLPDNLIVSCVLLPHKLFASLGRQPKQATFLFAANGADQARQWKHTSGQRAISERTQAQLTKALGNFLNPDEPPEETEGLVLR